MEQLAAVPAAAVVVRQSLVFSLGTFLPSLAEDILTRGYLFRHLEQRTSRRVFVLLSPAIYVLNHIYALSSGPTQLTYLFVIGLMLAVPLLVTRNLWYTVGAHWAGNIIYRISNDVLTMQDGPNPFPDLWELALFTALLIPINYMVAAYLQRRLQLK
jgi:membrane protease YdiL (CAAX protease family)